VPLVVGFTLAIGLFWVFGLTKAVEVRRRPPMIEPARVVGAEAVVRAPGQVFVEGELWRAHRADGGDLVPGAHVRVAGMEGLELIVTTEE
jgi:membrane protein implicated in regulation of membrane protease activity